MVKVKICGITNADDARAAVRLGADALGFVFAESPRKVSPKEAESMIREIPALVHKVGVFVNAPQEWVMHVRVFCGLDAVQLHGDETEAYAASLGNGVIKAVRIGRETPQSFTGYPSSLLLLDTYDPRLRGGTGKAFDWHRAVEVAAHRPIILAGGLNPDTVADAVKLVRPFAVDVSGGVELEPGRKDYDKVARFIRNAKTVALSS